MPTPRFASISNVFILLKALIHLKYIEGMRIFAPPLSVTAESRSLELKCWGCLETREPL